MDFHPVVPLTHYLLVGLAGMCLSIALIAAWLLVRDILTTNRPNKIVVPDWNFQPERDNIRIIQENKPYDWAQETE